MLKLNADGIPITDMQHATGAQPQLPIVIGSAPDIMDPQAELRRMNSDEQSQTIADMQLDKVKARAAAAKAARIREEATLALTEEGFQEQTEPAAKHDPMMPQQPQQTGMDPSMLLSGLSKWDPEARQDLFDRLADDPEFALNLSRAFNPQQQMPMNQQQGMNPWMNPMMMQQPQMATEPQESAASMMTAVIGAVAQIKELSGGGDDGSSAMLERMMDRMERLDERQAERDAAMQQKMMEMQQAQGGNQVSPQEIQQMIHATIANSSTDQLAETIKSISGVVGGLQELGVVKRADADAASSKDRFEELKWKDKMAFDREGRDREDTREARSAEIELAKQDTTKGMFSMLLNMSQDAKESSSEDDLPVDEKPLAPAVARAVVS